ncbi:MAG TPA: YSC84-related protein [Candidatus Binatia bacterium]|jgi:lipid-binding SYLF domain-containing protein
MRTIFYLAIAALLFTACSSASPRETMQRDVDQATAIIERFQSIPEQGIPATVLRNARGLAILTVTKAGFIGSGRAGSGVVIARLGSGGWSGPSAIGTGGLGVGFQAGVQITEFVIVLNTPAAVDAFSRGGNVTLGGALSVAAGPIGRSAEGNVALQAAMFSYSRSQGLFAGVSLEGTVITTRDDLNRDFYGSTSVTATDILSGRVRPPAGAQRLIAAVTKY